MHKQQESFRQCVFKGEREEVREGDDEVEILPTCCTTKVYMHDHESCAKRQIGKGMDGYEDNKGVPWR